MISTQISSWFHFGIALALAPLLSGVIARTKAILAGRTGPPLLQQYRDLGKLMRKGAVYSRATTPIFRLGPVAGAASAILALAFVPLGGSPAPISFEGDFVLFVYLFGVMRFVTILAALDTGSSFEAMGASRDAAYSAVAEVALFLALAAVARKSGSLSLSVMLGGVPADSLAQTGPAVALVAATLLVVLLAENARIPFDDPATHLELTMIHEVMILDHGGPDLAMVLYGSSLKLWALGMLLVGASLPVQGSAPGLGMTASLAALAGLAIVVGLVESTMARLRLLRVPQLLAGAAVLSAVALLLALR